MEGDIQKLLLLSFCPLYFYPRPPGGGRRKSWRHRLEVAQFLSTPSGWRATREMIPASIRMKNFYPRPPGGGRQPCTPNSASSSSFLSTPSGWRATTFTPEMLTFKLISIHALRVEGDRFFSTAFRTSRYFYPRPPGGGRRYFEAVRRRKTVISIHALRVEGDVPQQNASGKSKISIHALRVEGDGAL